MRIVHICLNGPVTDGWNYQDNMLSKYHRKAGHDVTIITSKWVWGMDGKLTYFNKSNYYNDDDVYTIRLELIAGKDINYKFRRFENLYKTIAECRPDILFIHGVASRENINIVKYLKYHPECVAYADNHSDFSNSATNWLSKNILHKIIWRYYANKLVPYVKKFYGVLPARVDFLVDIYKLPKDKCELLVMGADDELVKIASKIENIKKIRKKYNINEEEYCIVTGGKIDLFKTQTLLLMEAIHEINNIPVKLLVFGSVDSKIKNKFDSLVDNNKVQYIGWIEANESYNYFAAADLVVFPGRHSVFWEQVVGQGIPMICKYWKGTTHIDIGGNVKFLYKDNVDEIMNVITTTLCNNDEYSRMKMKSRDSHNKFSYKNIAMKSLS